jgi:hypothetical protein
MCRHTNTTEPQADTSRTCLDCGATYHLATGWHERTPTWSAGEIAAAITGFLKASERKQQLDTGTAVELLTSARDFLRAAPVEWGTPSLRAATPAPWEIEHQNHRELVRARAQSGQRVTVADCGLEDNRTAQANARLIVQAPGLLVVVRQVVATADGPRNGLCEIPADLVDRAGTLVAKLAD